MKHVFLAAAFAVLAQGQDLRIKSYTVGLGCDTGNCKFMSRSFMTAAQTVPLISKIANAEGESATIAPNTWVEIKGSNLAAAGDTRIWQGSDFTSAQMP